MKKKYNSDLIDESENDLDLKDERNTVNVGRQRAKKNLKLFAMGGMMILFIASAIFLWFTKNNKTIVYELDKASIEQYNKENRQDNIIESAKEEQRLAEKRRAEEEARLKAEEARLKAEEEARSKANQANNSDTPKNTDSGNNSYTPVKNDLNIKKFGGSILLPDSNITTVQNVSSNQEIDDTSYQSSGSGGDFLKSPTFGDGSVSRLLNRDFLITSGTVLNCVLKTKVVTTYEGLVACQLSKDIYSDNGKNLLIRAGSVLEGTQTKVMMQGQARVFINWATVRDRDLLIRIDALGTDMLGASGVPAWVDNHFWKRFGNALLLTFIEDAFAIAQTHANKAINAENVTMDNFGNEGSRMAEIALENSINIPPTAYINQGEIINVIIPRNIDFSKVYKNVGYR